MSVITKKRPLMDTLRLIDEGRVSTFDVLRDITEDDLIEVLLPVFSDSTPHHLLTVGDGVLAGDVAGQLILDRTAGEQIFSKAEVQNTTVDVIYSTPSGDFEDFAVLQGSRGFFTSHSGRTTFCPVQASCEGIPTIVGVSCKYVEYPRSHKLQLRCKNGASITLEQPVRGIRFPNGEEVREGEYISISGRTGNLYRGKLPTVYPLIARVYQVLTMALLEASFQFGNHDMECRITETNAFAQDSNWLMEAVGSQEFQGFQKFLHAAHDALELKVLGTVHTAKGMSQTRLYGSHVYIDDRGEFIVKSDPTKYGLGLLRDERMWNTQDRIDLQRIIMLGKDIVGEDYPIFKAAYLKDFISLLQDTFRVGVGHVAVVRLLCVPFNMLFSSNFDIKKFAEKYSLDRTLVENRVRILSSEGETYHGCRGVRFTVQREDITELWCEGILCAAKHAADQGQLSALQILLAMVTLPQEVRKFIEVFERKIDELGFNHESWIRGISVMIETSGAFHLLEDILSLRGHEVKVNGALFGGNDFTAACLNMSRADSGTLIVPNYVGLGLIPTNPFQSINVQVIGKVILQALRRIRMLKRDTRYEYLLGLGGEIAGDWRTVQWLSLNATAYGLNYISTAPERILFSLFASAQVSLTEY